MRTNKIISAATAVLILSLATACSFFSDDSRPDAETEKRTPAVAQAQATTNGDNATPDEKANNVPEDTAVFLLTGEDTGGRITNEDLERLREDMAKSKNSEEPLRTARELTAGKETPSEDQRWCLAWALDNLKPHIYAEFAKLDPRTMDDLDRTVWRPRLKGNSPHGYYQTLPTYSHGYHVPKPTSWANMVGTCWMYWSEPLSETNADKRSFQYEAECLRRVARDVDATWERRTSAAASYETPVYEIPDQYVRILRWLDTPGHELLDMDEPPYEVLKRLSDKPWAYATNVRDGNKEDPDFDIQWVGILRITLSHHSNNGGRVDACRFYYPQLFYGYWVPFAEQLDEPPAKLPEEELAEIKRITAGPLYLPKP